jgi:phage terminase Nu1 subunit (DNA packaging protein)
MRAIANALKLDRDELDRLATEDRINAKYGKVASVLSGVPHRLQQLATLEPQMSDRDIEETVALWQTKAKMNKSSERKVANR